MANVEETSNKDIIFRGNDGTECEEFVVAIRDIAFAKGKDEDHSWMVRYATTRLRGNALRWHAKLDLSVQQSWYLFVQALFEEYPVAGERDGGGIVTPVWTTTTFSPAPSTVALPGNNSHLTTTSILQSAGTEVVPPRSTESSDSISPGGELVLPPRVYDSSLPGYYMGRLRVVYEDPRPGPHWIRANLSPRRVTSDPQEALIVTFISSSESHHINSADPKLGVGVGRYDLDKFHRLHTTYERDVSFSGDGSSYQVISGIWSISADGTLNPTLPNLVRDAKGTNELIHSGNYSTNTVYVDISGETVSFVQDYSTPRATHPSSGLPLLRARIVFEPL
ncbi:hypothetical protein M407DRAFT_19729 [Tulasnella calospora MUT 4182]|uniref:Uncharacterized protein n=1 Tax=Tulasnella calospora MUT 4182 TaxID=1051891 RepID=A0A0C3MC99_9AGAM|nr:hypothetical protein M407DRAFT_19729 [Tulasnella calospora MUT 4182]